MKCDLCCGRGWIMTRCTDFPETCSFCGGKGSLTWGFVARSLGEHPSTLARVRRGRSRQTTCERVLEKVVGVLWPKGQKEMFAS